MSVNLLLFLICLSFKTILHNTAYSTKKLDTKCLTALYIVHWSAEWLIDIMHFIILGSYRNGHWQSSAGVERNV